MEFESLDGEMLLRIRQDQRGISNVIVVMLSLVILVIISANVILWSYQMNRFDWEKMQEDVTIVEVTEVWSYFPSGYVLRGSTSLMSGSVSNLNSDDGDYMIFRSYYSGADTSDFVDNDTSDVDSSPDKGTHSNFTAQQYGPDSIYDTLEEESIEVAEDNNVDSEIVTHGETTGISDAQTVDDVTENMTEASPTEDLYIHSAYHVNASAENDAPPASPWVRDIEFTSSELTAVNASDSSRATTTGGSATLNPAHQLVFYTSIDPVTITDLGFHWEGYGDAGTSTLYVWNTTASAWINLGSHSQTTQDGIVDAASTNTGLVNASGYIHLCAVDISPLLPTFIKTNYVYVNVTAEYQLEIEHVVNSVGNYQNYNLTVKCYRSAENFYLQMYNFTSNTWTNSSTVTASSLTWYNSSFVKADFVNGTNQARIRYWQGVDSNQETLYVDYCGIYGWNPSTYELDLEVQWTDINYTRSNEELCIKTGSFERGEDIRVEVWHSSSWNWLMNLTSSQWNNVSVASYLDSAIFTVRFKGGTETGDTTRDSWEVDVTLLHVWDEEYTCEVEFTGSSNTESWSQLNWKVDSGWTTSSVNVTLQLYNYTLDGYPTSGNGYIAYTSSEMSNTDETENQTITVHPTHFRNDTGWWKMRVKGVKAADTKFYFKADWVGFEPVIASGTLFTFENTGSLTSHLVSLWVTNSTHHRRYDIDLFINSGETLRCHRSDINVPDGQYTVKIVTERGNTAVLSGE